MNRDVLIVVDDRELVGESLRGFVGGRRHGDIIFSGRRLFNHFQASMPDWVPAVIRLCSDEDVTKFRRRLETVGEDTAALFISGRAGFHDYGRLHQLIEKLPYARESFTDSLYKPLIVFMHKAHSLIEQWAAFEKRPLHAWEQVWRDYERLQSVQQFDLANLDDFLHLITGSTAARHFNHIQVDPHFCTKSSADRQKILAEYSFYGLAPEEMQPWLVQPFNYQDDGETASYKMLRYRIADASLPWVHGAFNKDSFANFLDRLCYFLEQRPVRKCNRKEASAAAHEIFVDKLNSRVERFLSSDEGRKIDAMVSSSTGGGGAHRQVERYLRLYGEHQQQIELNFMAVGHGDPCLSNILYDVNSRLLMLLDPRGAIKENELWANPLYDYCKVSHSILGGYDFIINGMFDIGFTSENALEIRLFGQTNHTALQKMFKSRLSDTQYSLPAIRLCEASLFLSMLPLHLDQPNKVLAFIVRATEILDEVANV